MMNYNWIPFFIIAIDQLSKRSAVFWHDSNTLIQFGCIKNDVIWNKGISFGLFSKSYYNALIYCCVILSILLILLAWARCKNRLDSIGWGLIVGGGLSNLWDRWFFGGVLDFIHISFDNWHFPIFNVADISITIGCFILGRGLFKRSKKRSSDNLKMKN